VENRLAEETRGLTLIEGRGKNLNNPKKRELVKKKMLQRYHTGKEKARHGERGKERGEKGEGKKGGGKEYKVLYRRKPTGKAKTNAGRSAVRGD